MAITAANYILPLVVGQKIDDQTVDELHRYAGLAFYIGSQGLIATCAHIVESINDQEILIAKDFNLNTFLEVKDIKCHDSMDFAVGRLKVDNNRFFLPIDVNATPLLMGMNVQTFGYVTHGKKGADLSLKYRYFKGYISCLGNKPDPTLRCRTLCELSFPALSGYSGAPLIFSNSQRLAGIIYGNAQSSIEEYSFTEIEDTGEKYSEKIYRTIEFGLAHTINDIIVFLDDLKVEGFK